MADDTAGSLVPNLEKIVSDSGGTIASAIATRVFAGIALGVGLGIAVFIAAYSFGALDTDGSVAKYAVWGLLPLDAAIAAAGLGYAGFALGYSTALHRVFFQSGVVAKFVGDLLDRVGTELVGRADAAAAVDAAIEAKNAEDSARKGFGAYAARVARKLKVFIYRVCARVLVAELAETNKITDDVRVRIVDTVVGRVSDLVVGQGRSTALVSLIATTVVLALVTAGVALLI